MKSVANVLILENSLVRATDRRSVFLKKMPVYMPKGLGNKWKVVEQPDLKAIVLAYAQRKCTVAPVIGIIKKIPGFRQFSLRGLKNVGGEFNFVALARNLKRMFVFVG